MADPEAPPEGIAEAMRVVGMMRDLIMAQMPKVERHAWSILGLSLWAMALSLYAYARVIGLL